MHKLIWIFIILSIIGFFVLCGIYAASGKAQKLGVGVTLTPLIFNILAYVIAIFMVWFRHRPNTWDKSKRYSIVLFLIGIISLVTAYWQIIIYLESSDPSEALNFIPAIILGVLFLFLLIRLLYRKMSVNWYMYFIILALGISSIWQIVINLKLKDNKTT